MKSVKKQHYKLDPRDFKFRLISIANQVANAASIFGPI